MTEPVWVTRQQVEFIHEAVIEIAGGAQGVRDVGLLESALARPQNLYAYGEANLFRLAASYAEAISRNHPFLDGNKRTAFYVAIDFLEQNGYLLRVAQDVEHAKMMDKLAQGKLGGDQAAEHLKKYSDSAITI